MRPIVLPMSPIAWHQEDPASRILFRMFACSLLHGRGGRQRLRESPTEKVHLEFKGFFLPAPPKYPSSATAAATNVKEPEKEPVFFLLPPIRCSSRHHHHLSFPLSHPKSTSTINVFVPSQKHSLPPPSFHLSSRRGRPLRRAAVGVGRSTRVMARGRRAHRRAVRT